MKLSLLPHLVLCTVFFVACQEQAPTDPAADNPNEGTENANNHADEQPSEETEECGKKEEFIPAGWKILKETKGDLNKDGKADLVLVIQNTDPKKIEKDEYFTLDTNPRTLLILFAQETAGCYSLNTESKTFILAHEQANMEDPFSEVEIKNGTLHIQFVQFANAGGWDAGNNTYVWRYQDGAFKLIGANTSDYHRASGEAHDVSVNFSTGKYSITHYNMFDESVEEEEVWKKLKDKTLQTFKTFPLPYSWKVNEDIYL
jgi:hypothetical protein